MKKVLNVLLVLLFLGVLVACQNDRGNNEDLKEALVVGLEVDYAPFNWAETTRSETNWPVDGQSNMYAEGYDVQVAKHIANQLGRRLVIKQIVWDSLVDAIVVGEIDLIIAGMSPRPDRALTIDFTNAYYNTNHVVVVRNDGAYANITSLAGLNGANGVAQKGTTYADLVEYVGTNHQANVLPVLDTVPLISTALIGGTADFTVVEKPVALGMIAAFPNLKIMLDDGVNHFNVTEADTTLSIGISKNNFVLRDMINAILSHISQETRDSWMSDAVVKQGA